MLLTETVVVDVKAMFERSDMIFDSGCKKCYSLNVSFDTLVGSPGEKQKTEPLKCQRSTVESIYFGPLLFKLFANSNKFLGTLQIS